MTVRAEISRLFARADLADELRQLGLAKRDVVLSVDHQSISVKLKIHRRIEGRFWVLGTAAWQ